MRIKFIIGSLQTIVFLRDLQFYLAVISANIYLTNQRSLYTTAYTRKISANAKLLDASLPYHLKAPIYTQRKHSAEDL